MSDAPLTGYLDLLFARARPSTLVEVRWRTPTGMRQRFAPVADRAAVAELVTALGTRTDVYVGVLPRWREAGGRAAVVGDGRTVWVDLDSDVATRALEPVDPPPSLIVASGGPGHLHAYWSLTAGAPPQLIERANRRLAWALGGDLHSTDAARILRPPATLHHGHGHGHAPVRLLHADPDATCRLGELTAGLLDPPADDAPRRPRSRPRARPQGLTAIEPARYVSVLTGQPVGRTRKIRCPLHDDRTPSLHVYQHPDDGWYCFGCRRGGSIFDLAAELWLPGPSSGLRLRGSRFLEIRQRLLAVFSAADPP